MFDVVLQVIPTKAFVLSYAVFKGVFGILGILIHRSTGAKVDQRASWLLSVIDFPIPSFFIPSTWLRQRSPLFFLVLNSLNGLYFAVWVMLILTALVRDVF